MKNLENCSAKATKFQKVKIKNNWGRLEYFIGGEKLSNENFEADILFPDGTTSRCMVICEDYHTTVYDHGIDHPVKTHKFFVQEICRGIKIKIPLNDLEISF